MIESNAATKSATLRRHKAAFGLWFFVHQILENAVIRDRNLRTPFARALDFSFIQAFKSHGSLYPLCVLGHCEDGATIARRIFEIALQVGYLASEESERENRGRQYLAHFFHIVPGILADPSLEPQERRRWQQLYDQNKQFLKFSKSGKPSSTWSGLSIAGLASRLKMQKTYDEDYRFLSNIAHASSAGSLLRIREGKLQIKDDTAATPILIYGTRYVLSVVETWTAHFDLIEEKKMSDLKERSLKFDLHAAAADLRTTK